MLSLLFAICMIWFVGKFFVFGLRAAQRIRLIRIIEKTEKNPEFSNKIGIKNTSE